VAALVLISAMIIAAIHCGFRMVDDGNSPFTLIELVCVIVYGMLIGLILVGPSTEE
jgi:hypothetical protein